MHRDTEDTTDVINKFEENGSKNEVGDYYTEYTWRSRRLKRDMNKIE